MSQISLFDGTKKFVINKPIRLIELFGGYGSQDSFVFEKTLTKENYYAACELCRKLFLGEEV